MFFRHHTDKLLYPLLLAVILMVISYRPTYHLRPDMPPGFFISSSDSVQKRSEQNKIALAYWQAARANIQYRYTYGHSLPPDAPPEFSIDPKSFGARASDTLTRALYWQRLQQVWYLPETWTKDYGWDWSWVSDPITSAAEWMRDTWNRWFAMHGPK